MKTAEEILKDQFYKAGDTQLTEGRTVFSVNKAFLTALIRNSFNYAIDLAADNADADYTITDPEVYKGHKINDGIECYVLRESILSLKDKLL